MRTEFYAEYFELEDWHWWFLGRSRILLSVLERHVGAAPRPCRLLDFGCGTGRMLESLGRYGVTVGVDADAEAVRFCRTRGLQNVQHLGSNGLPFADGSFDVVTAFDVLEHIDDDVGALHEIRRVLRPGGAVLLSVPAYRFLWCVQDEIAHHKRRYTAGELRRAAAAAGLEERRMSYFNTLLAPPIALVRLLRRYRRAPERTRSDFAMTSPGALNALLARVFESEARLIERWDLPFGISIMGLFTKPAAPARRARTYVVSPLVSPDTAT